MFKAVIFDMDGVIVDSEQLSLDAFSRALNLFGISPDEDDVENSCGLSDKNIVAYMEKKYNKKIDYESYIEKKAEFYRGNVEEKGIHPFPKVRDFIEMLEQENIKYIVASSGNRNKIMYNLGKIRMTDVFGGILSGEDFDKGKPNPAIFLKAAQKLGVESKDCLVIEDSINGVQAAKNAKMKCIAITNTFKAEKLKNADLIVGNFTQITLDVMKKLYKNY